MKKKTFVGCIFIVLQSFLLSAQNLQPQPIPCLYINNNSFINAQNNYYSNINCVGIDNVNLSGNKTLEVYSKNSITVTNSSFVPDSGKHVHLYIYGPNIDAAWFVPNATPGFVGKYQKMEIGFKLSEIIQEKVDNFINEINPGNQLNPYDPDQLDVSITLQSPSNKQYIKPAFYYEPYENVGGTYIKQNTDFPFRFRFAPDELGTWKLSMTVVTPNQTINGNYVITFVCVPSNHNGYLIKGNYGDERDRYLYYKETNTTFKGIGMNISHSTYEDDWTPTELARHKTWIQSFANNGGNFTRLELGAQNALPDWIEYNNYTPRMKHMQMFDELIDLVEEKDIYFILFRHHAEVLKDGPEWDHVSWADNPYKKAFNLTQRMDFFTHPTVRIWQKKCLRYIMARWGYSSNMSVYEYSELDNFIPINEGRDTIFDKPSKSGEQTSIRNWLAEMAFTSKWYNQNLLFTITFTQGKSPSRLKELYELPKKTSYDFNTIVDVVGYHQYHDELKYTNIERLEQTYKLWEEFKKPVICEEIGFGDDPTSLIYCCQGTEFRNNIWATFMMGSMGSGMHWWWDRGVFLNEHEKSFKYLSNFLASETLENYSYKRYAWVDSKSKELKKTRIENFYLASENKERALGWVHNATYRWRNFVGTSTCMQQIITNNPNYTCVCEDGHLLAPGSFIYNEPEYIDHYGNNVSDVINETFTIFGLKQSLTPVWKHWYQIDFYHTQLVDPNFMYSYTLTLHTNGAGELKPPVTLKTPTPDYAYKVTYLGYYKNNPNARLAPDSTELEQNVDVSAYSADEINVHPNPFTNQIEINAPVAITNVFVYDITGNLLYSANPNQTTYTLLTETFAEGAYLLVVKANEKYYYKRIIKQE